MDYGRGIGEENQHQGLLILSHKLESLLLHLHHIPNPYKYMSAKIS